MRITTLTVLDGTQVLVDIEWRGARVVQREVAEELRSATERWLSQGVVLKRGTGVDSELMDVRPDDPQFPERLAEYLQTQTGFAVRMLTEIVPDVGDVEAGAATVNVVVPARLPVDHRATVETSSGATSNAA